MIYVLIGGCLWLLIWVGRRSTSRSDRDRLLRVLVAAVAAIAAVVAGLRGAWIASAALVVFSAWIGRSVRIRRGQAQEVSAMSVTQARSILGVGPTADRVEIERAYRRLIVRVHPDVGGAPGLAAQLNAARDVLLR